MEQMRYWVKLEIEHKGELFEREVGPFLDRDRAERVLERAISTVAISGEIKKEILGLNAQKKSAQCAREDEKRTLSWWALESVAQQIFTELAHTMKDEDERKERTNNIVAAMGDEEFGVDMIYDMLTPNEAHGGIGDQMERMRSTHIIVKICNPGVTNQKGGE